jgi:hypothetical protein
MKKLITGPSSSTAEHAVSLFDEFVLDGRGCRVSAARLQVRQAFPRRTSKTTRRGRISQRLVQVVHPSLDRPRPARYL